MAQSAFDVTVRSLERKRAVTLMVKDQQGPRCRTVTLLTGAKPQIRYKLTVVDVLMATDTQPLSLGKGRDFPSDACGGFVAVHTCNSTVTAEQREVRRIVVERIQLIPRPRTVTGVALLGFPGHQDCRIHVPPVRIVMAGFTAHVRKLELQTGFRFIREGRVACETRDSAMSTGQRKVCVSMSRDSECGGDETPHEVT